MAALPLTDVSRLEAKTEVQTDMLTLDSETSMLTLHAKPSARGDSKSFAVDKQDAAIATLIQETLEFDPSAVSSYCSRDTSGPTQEESPFVCEDCGKCYSMSSRAFFFGKLVGVNQHFTACLNPIGCLSFLVSLSLYWKATFLETGDQI